MCGARGYLLGSKYQCHTSRGHTPETQHVESSDPGLHRALRKPGDGPAPRLGGSGRSRVSRRYLPLSSVTHTDSVTYSLAL